MRIEAFFWRILALAVGAALVIGGAGCKQGPVDYDKFERRTVGADLTVVDSAGRVYDALCQAGQISAACESARAFFLARPGVVRAGIAEDSTVWAVFTNGLVAGCGPDDADFSAVGRSPDTERPAAPVKVRVQDGGEVASLVHYVMPHTVALPETYLALRLVVQRLSKTLGWEQSDSILDAQVDIGAVLGVINPGSSILYWNGHGTLVWFTEGGLSIPGICLGGDYATQAAAEKATTAWSAYLNPGDSEPTQAVIKRVSTGRFRVVILPAFVWANGDFDTQESRPDNNQAKTIVLLTTCFGGYGPNNFVEAFHGAGADVVLAYDWAETVGWASQNDTTFLGAMADSCFPEEAIAKIQNPVDPTPKFGLRASLVHVADSLVLLAPVFRVQMRNTAIRASLPVGYGRGNSAFGMSAFMHPAGDSAPSAENLGYLSVGVPDGADVYDCTTRDQANITWLDMESGRQYSVQKGFKGVSGTINIENDRSDVIVGRFEAKLGWWDFEQSHFPTQDPPDDTITFSGGLIRVTGKIPQAGQTVPPNPH